MEQNPGAPLLDFSVTPDMGSHLKETARWTRFLSIVSFIGLLLLLIGMVAASSVLTPMISKVVPGLAGNALSGLIFGILGVALVIGGILVFLLYRFSSTMKSAIELNDHALFNKALRSLKTYFLIYGVFAILALIGNIYTFTTIFTTR
jgi:hypothetical protein